MEATTDHISRLAGYGSHYMQTVQKQKLHDEKLIELKRELEREKRKPLTKMAPLTSKLSRI